MKKSILAFASVIGWIGAAASQPADRPNIVFILADDMGYGDVSCLNPEGKIKTPNLDRIARSGVVFTDAHSGSAVCTPTRYSLLTGRYSWRSTLKSGVLFGYDEAIIPSDRKTVAAMLKDQGYQTACFGKWHLGWTWNNISQGAGDVDFSKPITHGPTTLGFDYFYGISGSLDMAPYVYVENDRPTSVPDRETEGHNLPVGAEGYNGAFWRKGPTGSDFDHQDCLPNLTRRAVKYIEEKSTTGKPYFLYFPMPAPHTPLLPSEEFQGKSGVSPYADFVMMVDAEVGKILDAVKQSGQQQNTIVVFASDNGFAPAADLKGQTSKGHNPSAIYRGHKADLYDGGHRIPCLMQWPAKIRKAHVVSQTICLADFVATFAQISGYQLAGNEAEDSYNLLPAIRKPGYSRTIREATVHHSVNGNFSIRKGDWKLLLSPGSGGWSSPTPGKEEEGLPQVQLYNLKNDPSEKNNVYAGHPELVTELKALLQKYVQEGRSTPGKPQKNDGEYPWKQLEWMDQEINFSR